MRKILLSGLKYGQLGNRLFLQAHFIAFALEYKRKLIITNFFDYSKFLELESDNKFIYFVKNRLIGKLINFFFKVGSRLNYFYKVDEFRTVADYVKSKKFFIVLLTKWNLHENELVKKHRIKIIRLLKFKERFYVEAQQRIDSISDLNGKLLVGIHMRRTDYKTWRNGKYYYSLGQYASVMKKIEKQNINVHFIICSDERLSVESFDLDRTLISISNCSFIGDLLVLSKCDRIVGPPSTFNAWASYMGDVPLYTLKNPNEDFTLDNCKSNNGNIYNLIN